MSNDDAPRHRPLGTLEKAEAQFKAATTAPAPPVEMGSKMREPKEAVSLRIDRDVLEFYQDDGPGWQDRINAALRKAAGL
jgi:uncharacterized protein (DUF4415 family)